MPPWRMDMWWCIVSPFGGRGRKPYSLTNRHSLGYHAWPQLSRKRERERGREGEREKERRGKRGEGRAETDRQGSTCLGGLSFPIKYHLNSLR